MLAALLALALQDLDPIVERLKSDDPKVRDAATADLIKLGPAVLPAIKKLEASDDPEVRARVGFAIKEIERSERIARIRPAPRLTLRIDDVPLSDGIGQVFDPFGIKAKLDDRYRELAEQKISIDLKDATLWQAYDAFCAAAGLDVWTAHLFEDCSWTFARSNLKNSLLFADAGDVRVMSYLSIDGTTSDVILDAFVYLPPGTLLHSCSLESVKTLSEGGKELPASLRECWLQREPSRQPGRTSRAAAGTVTVARTGLDGVRLFKVEGRLVLAFPHDIERAEFNTEDFKEPIERTLGSTRISMSKNELSGKRPGWRFSYGPADPASPPPPVPDEFKVWSEDRNGIWTADLSAFAWDGSPSRHVDVPDTTPMRIVVARLIGQDAIEIPFTIKDIPVPAVPDK